MLRDYKGAESIDTTDPNTEVARQFAQASSRRVGRVLAGKYELIKTIGVGGMGAVFEARHQLTGRRVAVKLIHNSLAENRGHVARFMREAKAASEIGHPAIVDVLDAGTTEDGLVYMVLELLKGEDLEDAVRFGKLTVPEIVGVAIDVLDCLAAAHDHGVVHRDIKPENVFLALDDEGGGRRTKVLDFGIAKHLRDDPDTAMTRTGTIVGTPDFMSPEQARGDSVDGRTDLWAVGALLYYALAGEPPFVADNYNKLIIRVVTEDAPSIGARRQDLQPALVAVIDRAMRRKPDERWPDARSMLEALRAIPIQAGDAAVARGPGRDPVVRSGVWATASEAAQMVEPASVQVSRSTQAGGGRRSLLVAGLIVLALAASALAYVLLRPPEVARTIEPDSPEQAATPSRALRPEPSQPSEPRATETRPPSEEPRPGAGAAVIPTEGEPAAARPQGGRPRPPPAKPPATPSKRLPNIRRGYADQYE